MEAPIDTTPPIGVTGPTAHAQLNGLQASIHVVTQGPYFLSELVALDFELTNQTGKPFALDGASKPDSHCSSAALNAQITAGANPTYTLPQLEIACLLPQFMTTLAPGQTLT